MKKKIQEQLKEERTYDPLRIAVTALVDLSSTRSPEVVTQNSSQSREQRRSQAVKSQTKNGTSRSFNFPGKLMRALSDERYQDAIAWLPHGLAFRIVNIKKFSSKVIPKYFLTIKYASFTRMLNKWGFVRIHEGPDKGSYQHTLFRRDNPDLYKMMSLKKASKCPNPKSLIVKTQNADNLVKKPTFQSQTPHDKNDQTIRSLNVLPQPYKDNCSDDFISRLTTSVIEDAKRVLLRCQLRQTTHGNIHGKVLESNLSQYLKKISLVEKSSLTDTSGMSYNLYHTAQKNQKGPSAA